MDLNRARRRSALAAVLALAASPNGFTVTGFAEQVRVMTGQSIAGYSARHASYDLHKIRGKHLGSTNPAEPAATRSHPDAARTITALLTLRDQVITPNGSTTSASTPCNRSPTCSAGPGSTVYRHLDKTTIGRRPRRDEPPATSP